MDQLSDGISSFNEDQFLILPKILVHLDVMAALRSISDDNSRSGLGRLLFKSSEVLFLTGLLSSKSLMTSSCDVDLVSCDEVVATELTLVVSALLRRNRPLSPSSSAIRKICRWKNLWTFQFISHNPHALCTFMPYEDIRNQLIIRTSRSNYTHNSI